jgi:hypothetical protein
LRNEPNLAGLWGRPCATRPLAFGFITIVSADVTPNDVRRRLGYELKPLINGREQSLALGWINYF